MRIEPEHVVSPPDLMADQHRSGRVAADPGEARVQPERARNILTVGAHVGVYQSAMASMVNATIERSVSSRRNVSMTSTTAASRCPERASSALAVEAPIAASIAAVSHWPVESSRRSSSSVMLGSRSLWIVCAAAITSTPAAVGGVASFADNGNTRMRRPADVKDRALPDRETVVAVSLNVGSVRR